MSTQTTLNYRTNRDLFSNYHLDKHLPETEAWDQVDKDELQAAYDDIKQLWEREKDTAPKRNESQLEDSFIRPMFRKLGIPFEVEESTESTQRRPDYGFFKTEEDGIDAFQRREDGGDFYKNAIAVADAKRWGRKLDTRGKKKRDYQNPSHQIDQYLRFTSTTWGVLTNGQKWRLYYKPTSHRLDSYYEIDLPTVLEQGDLEDFKYFYLFFRHDAFIPDASGDAFLDDVYEESNVFAQELGEDLQDNIYEAIKLLSEGYLQYPENDLDKNNLELIHDSSLIYLYRIIFVLYAEAEGRDLLDTNNEIYESQYSLNQLKQEVADELESSDPKYRDWQSNLQSRLDELFTLIDQGSKSRGIPEEDLYIPAYNGGLFRTNPHESGSKEAQFLANNTVGDEHLARVIELLTRSESSNGGGKIFVDYSSLDVRHLGSIYEGLLEYQLNVADEPLALNDGEYVVADESSEVVVERDDVYLTTDSGERKSTGSYYTPEYVVEYIVEETLSGPVDNIRKDVVMDERYQDGGYAEEFAERIFDLKILDPAMGSGHFLTSVVDYLARAIITEQNREADKKDGDVIEDKHDINWARRKVAQRCIYGVDINPLATELAKVSLWLRTLAAEQPLAFLDHHLKTGNSLVGSDIQHVLADNDESKTDKGQLTLEQSFAHTRKQALDHVMDRFSELLAIDNETLEDAKEMEEVYQSVQNDPLYQKLLEMANVHTASQFGLDIPGDADKRMAEALRGDSWENIAGQDWFKSAQTIADDEHFFHWELEFPVAFYDIDGNRMENAGFDAVIGNPPYVSSRNEDFYEVMGEFVDSRYDLAVYQVDLYLLFTELAVDLTCDGGTWSYIEPDVWLGNVKGDDVRRWLVKHDVIKKFALPEDKVFDADVDCLILIGVSTKNGTDTVDVSKISEDEEIESYDVELPENGDVFPISENASLLSKVEQESIELDKIAKTGRGIGPYHHSKHSEETIETRAYHSDQQEDETYRPELAGKDIDRYVLNWDGDRWISYGDWLAEPREPELFEGERLLCRKILAKRLCCAYVDDDWLADQQVYVASQFKKGYRAQYAAAILASSLMGFYARTKYHEDTDLFPHLRVAQFRELPIREMTFDITESVRQKRFDEKKNVIDNTFKSDSAENLPEVAFEITNDEHLEVIHDSIVYLVEVLTETKKKRSNHNLNLLDYLSAYEEGSNLPDIGLFQPAKSNILDAKTGEYDKLQIERVKIEQNGSQLTIYATARYKPEDEDDFETDTYGYTETDFREAFTLNNLSDKEVTLVEAFVPVAVDKADGFANFRDNATKTNSLIDRLKSMTLPNIDDVEDDLKRYMEVKERADELDEKIEKTDQLIDEIVYDLYDLTDDEVEIVESATADD